MGKQVSDTLLFFCRSQKEMRFEISLCCVVTFIIRQHTYKKTARMLTVFVLFLLYN